MFTKNKTLTTLIIFGNSIVREATAISTHIIEIKISS